MSAPRPITISDIASFDELIDALVTADHAEKLKVSEV